MDKKSKIFFLIFFLLIVASVAATYWRIIVKKDYVVEAQTDCDPYAEKCFVWECDPSSTVEGEACTGEAEDDTWFYKINKRNAAKIPLCDSETDETCDPWTCAADEPDCAEIFCDAESAAEQEASCNDPVKYAAENPIEDEEEAIEEEVVECADPPAGETEGDTDLPAGEAEGNTECEAATEEEIVCEEGDEACTAEEETSAEENDSEKFGDAADAQAEEMEPASADQTASNASLLPIAGEMPGAN